MNGRADDRTLGELFSELSSETATLIRQEAALARSELTQILARWKRHAAIIVVGGVLAYAGVLTACAGLALVLIRAGLAPWLAAVVTAAALLVIGGLLVQQGLAALRRDPLAPPATLETLKENAQWAKNQMR